MDLGDVRVRESMNGTLQTGKREFVLTQHRVEVDQGSIHHLLARPQAYPTDHWIGTIPTLGRPFDGWEVHIVSVAVPEKECLVSPRSLLQSIGMITKKFA